MEAPCLTSSSSLNLSEVKERLEIDNVAADPDRLLLVDANRRAMLMVNIGLLGTLEDAIGHTETHLTQLRAVIDECRSAGWRCGYHEYLLLGAQDRLGRLRTRHAQELDDLAVLRYAG